MPAAAQSAVLLANGLRGAALQAGGESGEYTFEAFIAALFRGKRGSFIKEQVAVEDRSDFYRICREAWRQYEALAPSVRLKESEAFAAHLQEHPALLAPGKLEAMVTKAAAVEALVALPDRGPEAGGGARAKGAAVRGAALVPTSGGGQNWETNNNIRFQLLCSNNSRSLQRQDSRQVPLLTLRNLHNYSFETLYPQNRQQLLRKNYK